MIHFEVYEFLRLKIPLSNNNKFALLICPEGATDAVAANSSGLCEFIAVEIHPKTRIRIYFYDRKYHLLKYNSVNLKKPKSLAVKGNLDPFSVSGYFIYSLFFLRASL